MPNRPALSRETLERHLLVVVCAISAGIHGGLVREHFAEGVGAGSGFLAATVLLAGAAFCLGRSAAPSVTRATALLLAGLLVSYALAVTTGVPLLHPEVEPVDGLALVTKVVEAVGLVAALDLLRTRSALVLIIPRREGRLT
jgi:hypothetical protein